MGNSFKGYIQSKTLWGIVIAMLPTVLRLAGVPLPPGVDEAIVGIGSSLGIYGRVTATQRLAFNPK